jgi:sec-independent protein translocase protein TatC
VAPPLDVPAWATWATLAVLLVATLAAALTSAFLGRRRQKGMPFMGHVTEVRRRLLRIVAALAAGLATVFLVRVQPQAPWLGVDPYDNLAAQVFRRMAADLVPDHVRLVATRPTDGFVALFDVALALAVLLTLPYLMAQVAGFLWPALRRRERRVLLGLLAPAFLLFGLGALFAYRYVLPTTFGALYGFVTAVGAESLLAISEFAGFAALIMVVAGFAFQTPLVMYGIARAGLASPAGYLRAWRHAVLAIVVVAALATPDPTPVSQMLVALPLVGLYFLGIAAAIPAHRAFLRANPGA